MLWILYGAQVEVLLQKRVSKPIVTRYLLYISAV